MAPNLLSKGRNRLAAIGASVTLVCAAAVAGAAPHDHSSASGDPLFAEGDWSGYAYGSTVFLDDDHGSISTAHVGGGYHFDDAVSINLELLGGAVDSTTDDDGGVGGVDALFRWHFLREDDWSLYTDGGAGVQQATTDFPSDSHHNFRLLAGVGATWRLAPRWHLMGGARYLHVSNASTSEGNDGGDWAQVYAGLMLEF